MSVPFAPHALPCGCIAHQPASTCPHINPLRVPMRGVSDAALDELLFHARMAATSSGDHERQIYAALIELREWRRKE